MKTHQKKWLILLLIISVSICGFAIANRSQAAVNAYNLDWSVIGSGGSAETQISSTLGQTAIGWGTGALQLGSGFWYGTETPATTQHYIFLPMTIK